MSDRAPSALPPLLRIGECEINTATRECTFAGRPVHTRPQVFDLLCLLIERRPATVTREELLQRLWGRGRSAASAVARAVLEARRAIGDDPDAPRLIVNVHGVGYRFAGTVDDGTPAAAGDSPLAQVRTLLAQTERAYEQRGGAVQSRQYALAALAIAMEHGLHVERGRALCWLGWLALWSGDADEAARHIGHAMSLALNEGHEVLLAQVRTVDGFLRLTLGDFDRALQQLQAAHEVLARGCPSEDRYRCENLLSAVSRHLDDLAGAAHWVQAAERTAQAAGLRASALRAQANRATLGLAQGQEHERQGDAAAAHSAWSEALTQCDRLLATLQRDEDPWLWIGTTGNRGVLLGRLGRTREARVALAVMSQALDELPATQAPAVRERRIALGIEMARLQLREGDHAAALQRVGDDIRQLDELPPGPWQVELLEIGSAIAERCGRLDLALAWTRRQLALQLSLEQQRARRLASVMRTESMHDELRRELDEARRTVHHLERLNADLLRGNSADR